MSYHSKYDSTTKKRQHYLIDLQIKRNRYIKRIKVANQLRKELKLIEKEIAGLKEELNVGKRWLKNTQ